MVIAVWTRRPWHIGWVAQADGESAELRELRRRVYGPGNAQTVTDTDVERLRQLENRDPYLEQPPTDIVSSVENAGVVQEADDEAAAVRPARFGRLAWRGWLMVACAAVALTALGFGVGVALTTPRPLEVLPEFTFPQTDEDTIPAEFHLDDPIFDPTSTRFIARIDGYDVFLAQPAEFDGVCIVAYRSDTPESTSAGCTSGPGTTGDGRFGIDESLEIGYGVAGPDVIGEPIRLSESVTAYRR